MHSANLFRGLGRCGLLILAAGLALAVPRPAQARPKMLSYEFAVVNRQITDPKRPGATVEITMVGRGMVNLVAGTISGGGALVIVKNGKVDFANTWTATGLIGANSFGPATGRKIVHLNARTKNGKDIAMHIVRERRKTPGVAFFYGNFIGGLNPATTPSAEALVRIKKLK